VRRRGFHWAPSYRAGGAGQLVAVALVAICRRAAAAGGAAPATTKAAVYVTITLADLKNQSGAGECLGTGRLLAPGDHPPDGL